MARLTKPEQVAVSRARARSKDKDLQRDEQPTYDFWKLAVKPMELPPEEFRFLAQRGGRTVASLKLDGVAESCEWTESMTDPLQGTLVVRRVPFTDYSGAGGYNHFIDTLVNRYRPKPVYRPGFDINIGHRIICQAAPVGYMVPGQLEQEPQRFVELWGMRVQKPTYTISESSMSLELADDSAQLQAAKEDWKFVKSRSGKHKNGWLPSEIFDSVCSRYKIPRGKRPKGTKRIDKLVEEDTSPWDIIKKAYQSETDETGQQYQMVWRSRALSVLPLQRGQFLYLLGDELIEASIATSQKAGFATLVDVSSKVGGKKYSFQVKDQARIDKYGRIPGTLSLEGDYHSRAAARKRAKRELSFKAKPDREVTLTHPGISRLHAGDAIRIQLDQEGLKKDICFVKEVHHQVEAGNYQMDVTVTFDDPFVQQDEATAKKKICGAAAKRHGRKAPDYCSELSDDAQAPDAAKSDQRSDQTDTSSSTSGGAATPGAGSSP